MKTTLTVLILFALLGSQAVLADSEKKTATPSAGSNADTNADINAGTATDKAADEQAAEEEPDCD